MVPAIRSVLPASVRALNEAGPLTHLTTVNADGSPQVSVVWIGLDGAWDVLDR